MHRGPEHDYEITEVDECSTGSVLESNRLQSCESSKQYSDEPQWDHVNVRTLCLLICLCQLNKGIYSRACVQLDGTCGQVYPILSFPGVIKQQALFFKCISSFKPRFFVPYFSIGNIPNLLTLPPSSSEKSRLPNHPLRKRVLVKPLIHSSKTCIFFIKWAFEGELKSLN